MSKKHDHEISLLNDAMRVKGVGVTDIYGYISYEFGDPVFKITRIHLNTDSVINVEGEHDFPYIPNDDDIFTYPEDGAEGVKA